MLMIDTYKSLYLTFLNFTTITVLTIFNEVFCLVDDNGVATRFCSKKLKLPICKPNSGMHRLSYVGPSTWNKLPNNIEPTASANCFKHDIKKYFLKNSSDTEADIYGYV